jgi:hypothetical protein
VQQRRAGEIDPWWDPCMFLPSIFLNTHKKFAKERRPA